jgi:hypothetical protein
LITDEEYTYPVNLSLRHCYSWTLPDICSIHDWDEQESAEESAKIDIIIYHPQGSSINTTEAGECILSGSAAIDID